MDGLNGCPAVGGRYLAHQWRIVDRSGSSFSLNGIGLRAWALMNCGSLDAAWLFATRMIRLFAYGALGPVKPAHR